MCCERVVAETFAGHGPRSSLCARYHTLTATANNTNTTATNNTNNIIVVVVVVVVLLLVVVVVVVEAVAVLPPSQPAFHNLPTIVTSPSMLAKPCAGHGRHLVLTVGATTKHGVARRGGGRCGMSSSRCST